jgi:hypothetical protein
LEANLGESPDVAITIAVGFRIILGQSDLNGYAVQIGFSNLRCKQSVVGSGSRSANLQNLALRPGITAN